MFNCFYTWLQGHLRLGQAFAREASHEQSLAAFKQAWKRAPQDQKKTQREILQEMIKAAVMKAGTVNGQHGILVLI